MKKEKNPARESKINIQGIAPDMKLYFNEMFGILRYQGFILSMAGMNAGRSRIDIVRELLINSVERIGRLDAADSDEIGEKEWFELFAEKRRKFDSEEIIPKSKLPKKYKGLFQDIRALYFLGMEQVVEEVDGFPYGEDSMIGLPVVLIGEMLDKIVDGNLSKTKWDEIKGDSRKVEDFYIRTKWQVDDLLQFQK